MAKSCEIFRYYHPEELKAKRRQGQAIVNEEILAISAKKPCIRCSRESTCDIPCDAYLRWYDASMEQIRKQVEM